MDGDACVEEKNGGDAAVDPIKKEPTATTSHRYTKVMEGEK